MAKKGQKFQRYTEEFKSEMLANYLSGIPAKVLSEHYHVPKNTIATWEYQSRQAPRFHKQGRPKGTPDYKERYELLKKFQAFLKVSHETK